MSTPWPFADLVIRSERLELRLPDDHALAALAAVAALGIHPPEELPFLTAWSTKPSPERELGVLQFHWNLRATLSPRDWSLPFAVLVDREPIGIQDVFSTDFAIRRTVGTGSWLGRDHQGRGLGTEMRSAVLAFAFDHLGAVRAESSALDGSAASERISTRLGYRDNGTDIIAVEGRRRIDRRFVMELDDWRAAERLTVEVEGLEPCLPLLGAA